MKYLRQILMLFVSMVVLKAQIKIYVWLLMFQKKAIYSHSNETNIIEEFIVYGLDRYLLYFIGALKIIAAIGLLIGLFYKKFIIPSSLVIAFLMLGTVIMHLKVSDQIHKFIPAILMLFCSISIVLITKREIVK